MAIVYGNHIPQHQWHEFAYKSWRYTIPRQDAYHDDRLLLGYDSHFGAWRIFINDHEAAQVESLDDAKQLAVMLYKLHPEWRAVRTIFRTIP
jgi:hypothetical protein